MFEFLLKYPEAVFSRGTFVLLGGWPLWLLGLAILAAAAGLGWVVWQRAGSGHVAGVKSAAGWLLQKLLASVLLLMPCNPA